MPALNWFDVLLASVVITSIFLGLRSGVARVVIGLIATCIGFFFAFWNYRFVATWLSPYIESEAVRNIIGFLSILFAVMAVGGLFGYVLTKLLKVIGLSWLNHLMGGIIGAARGALLASVIVAGVVAFAPSPLPGFLTHSALLPYVDRVSSALTSVVPKEVKDAFDARMGSIKRFWTAQQEKQAKEI